MTSEPIKVKPLWRFFAIVSRWLNGELPESRLMTDSERFDLAVSHLLLRARLFDELAEIKFAAFQLAPEATVEERRAICAAESDWTNLIEGEGVTAFARCFQVYRNACRRIIVEFERTGHVVDASALH